MGLTIHYHLKSTANNPQEARRSVELLRQAALDLPFAQVDEIVELSDSACSSTAGHDGAIGWLITQAHCLVDLGASGYRLVPPTHLIAFSAWPGEGSEVANFGLATYPESVEAGRGLMATGVRGWSWASFCKTQYASDPSAGGVENFLRCHLLVVRVLDHAQTLGILESVTDESQYWESRDAKALGEVVGVWNQHIAGIVGSLKDSFAGKILAPIAKYPNFEHLEAEGRRKKPRS